MIQDPYLSEEDAKKYLQDLLNELNKQSSDK
jgi:polyhydroxyalkanoate synthesis regulator phasin